MGRTPKTNQEVLGIMNNSTAVTKKWLKHNALLKTATELKLVVFIHHLVVAKIM